MHLLRPSVLAECIYKVHGRTDYVDERPATKHVGANLHTAADADLTQTAAFRTLAGKFASKNIPEFNRP